jgi:small subunit ribosomal protein S5
VANESKSDSPEKVIQIRRCACVVKGGRRFSFTAMVVVGDKRGRVGWGYGKGGEVPIAVEKAVKAANRRMVSVTLAGHTVPHQVVGRYGTSRVFLIPATPGTGIKAGEAVRSIMESAGFTDILSKCMGSTNPINLVKATFDALSQLRTREEVARLRGVEI